jgi:hypothetical protein
MLHSGSSHRPNGDVKQPPQKKRRSSPSPAQFSPAKSPPISLPPLLSPSLPDAFVKALEKAKTASPSPDWSEAKAGRDRTEAEVKASKHLTADRKPEARKAIPGKPLPNPTASAKEDRGKFDKAVVKDSELLGFSSSRDKANGPAKQESAQKRPAADTSKKPKSSVANDKMISVRRSPIVTKKNGDPALVLKFQFPPALRKTVGRILSDPATGSSSSAAGKDSSEKNKRPAQALYQPPTHKRSTSNLVNSEARLGEKRHREEDKIVVQSKKQKPNNISDSRSRPVTPHNISYKSPAGSQPASAQKHKSVTSNPDVKLSRPAADAENAAHTPQAAQRTSTPAAPSSIDRHVNRSDRSSSMTSSSAPTRTFTASEISALKDQSTKYNALGRKLKHEAKHLAERADPKDEKLQLALCIEGILCFILSFSINEEVSGRTDSAAWESMFAWMQEITHRQSRAYPSMRGLCLQLDALCHDRAAFGLSKSIARKARPATTTTLAAVDETTTKPPTTTPKPQPSAEEIRTLTTDAARLHTLLSTALSRWAEGTSDLPVEDLERLFPKTWKGKVRVPVVMARERLDVSDLLGGGYYLPMSGVTTGIEAVRVGWRVLGEWVRSEGAGWRGRMREGR